MDNSEIQKEFNKVICYSQSLSSANTNDLFKRWEIAKAKYIEAWGGLIYEYPEKVTFELDNKHKVSRIEDLIRMVEGAQYNFALSEFIRDNVDNFFSNILNHDYIIDDDTVIRKGTKIIKAFKYFIKDEALLESTQNYASRIIQENKITGTLCLSVHPLDFLSTSENCHNWRSCHALDGEYRAGNLSYMVDESTIICYLRADGEREYRLPDFPRDVMWNSKKWRTLLFFSDYDDMIFAGRQYPFNTDYGINFIREIVLPKSGLGIWDRWWKKKITNLVEDNNYLHLDDKFIPINGTVKGMRKLIVDKSRLHFNDLLNSTCYDPIYAFSANRYIRRDTEFSIGGEVRCLCCGKNNIEDSEFMTCLDCGGGHYACEHCGRGILEDEEYFLGDTIVCSNCFYELGEICTRCGESIYKEDACYDDGDYPYCRWCYENHCV